MTDALGNLKDITELKFQLDQAALANNVAQQNDIVEKIQTLRRGQISQEIETMDNMQHLTSGQYVHWQIWSENRIAELNLDLAQLRADAVRLVDATQTSFAKLSAVDTLQDRATREKRSRQRKQQEEQHQTC